MPHDDLYSSRATGFFSPVRKLNLSPLEQFHCHVLFNSNLHTLEIISGERDFQMSKTYLE